MLVDFDARAEQLIEDGREISSTSIQSQSSLFPVSSVVGLCSYKQPTVSQCIKVEKEYVTMLLTYYVSFLNLNLKYDFIHCDKRNL